jgi:uncharacterized membrane-anchored protein YjiN (DUF445 family)
VARAPMAGLRRDVPDHHDAPEAPEVARKTETPHAGRMAVPTIGADPETDLRKSLARHRGFASALLVLMGALMAAGYALPTYAPHLGIWTGPWAGLLRDAAKAGFIGGIADWFAITALFRHPLGLPIPHTAILPAQKVRLGDALGRFVADHVFTEADVGKFLAGLDIPGIVGRFLADPATSRPAAEALATMLPQLLASMEDGRARRLLNRLLPRLAGGPAAGQVLARALGSLVEGGRHQEVFSFVLGEIKRTLALQEEKLRDAIRERVREQGGALVGWALGATIARRTITAVNAELERIGPDSSEIRAAFDEWVRHEIERMETDPARAAELGASLRGVFAHETVRAWAWDVWARLRRALEIDAAQPSGRTVGIIEAALGNLGHMLAEDAAARARVTDAVSRAVLNLLPSAQSQIAGFIGRTVGAWDAATITEKLELRVGKDLQFIRVNGTLVGFVLGAAIYGLTMLLK